MTTQELLRQLDRLKQQNRAISRRLRIVAGTLAGLALLACLAMVAKQTPASTVPDVVRARKFELLDDHGSVRGEFAIGDEGRATVDAHHIQARAFIAHNRDGKTIVLIGSDTGDGGRVAVLSKDNKVRVSLGSDEHWGVASGNCSANGIWKLGSAAPDLRGCGDVPNDGARWSSGSRCAKPRA